MCEYMPSAKPAGIDKDMAKELHKKSKYTHSEEDKWFSIWDIIFPRTSRPSSPYIDDRLSEDASQLEELISNQWPSIIASVIAEAQITGVPVDVDRLRLQHVLSATFARLTDQFSAERERGMSALASTSRSPSAWATPPSTGADSGIDMASYQRERQSFSGSNYTTSSSGTATSSQLDRQTQNLMQRSSNDGRRETTRATQGHNTNMTYGQYDTTPAQGPPSQRDVTNEQSGMPPQTTYASDVMQDPVAMQTTAFNVDDYNFGAGLTGPDLDFLLEADPYIPLESSCVDTTLCVIPEDPLNYK
ncbi:hypothetical protein VSDG_07786 [Cytospora chrysosperma]|uniref:Uncharacterized protein n=1 Tax=Cytospora chrysosperma TaxID=252740 RepID=A0A423VK50_CYTCH|nr:hypothetical protein VSDG_07786 [Valsa sordida]